MSFLPTSRYYTLDNAQYVAPDGRIYACLRRRIVPPAEKFAVLQEHVVTQGDRLDNITARYLGDPTQFWRICDANRALNPEEMVEPLGRTLRITLPEGVPGTPVNA